MKYAYKYQGGKYTHEYILEDDAKTPEGSVLSDTRIDCTKFTPDENGSPVEIVVEEPIYVEPETSEVFTAANDVLYGNSAGNDTIYGNLA